MTVKSHFISTFFGCTLLHVFHFMMESVPASDVVVHYNDGISKRIPYNPDFASFMFSVKRNFNIHEDDGKPFLINQGNVKITEGQLANRVQKKLDSSLHECWYVINDPCTCKLN